VAELVMKGISGFIEENRSKAMQHDWRIMFPSLGDSAGFLSLPPKGLTAPLRCQIRYRRVGTPVTFPSE
jgi:hypothetical protein